MRTASTRSIRLRAGSLIATGALAAGLLGGLATPAAASAPTKSFCKGLATTSLTPTDASPDSAKFAIKRINELLKTSASSSLKRALRKIKKAYQRLSKGEAQASVFTDEAVLKAFTTFTRAAAKCGKGVTVTT